MAPGELQETAMEAIYRHLEGAGMRPTRTPERILTGIEDFSVWCRMDPPDQRPGICVLPMWFSAAIPGGHVIEESIAGIGETPIEAAVKGAHAWSEGVLPVLREVFDPAYEGEGARFDMASTSGDGKAIQWKVFAGAAQFMGEPAPELLKQLEDPPPFVLVLDSVTGYLGEPRPHWVKLLLHRINGKVDGEVRIDNELSPQALAQLRKFRWPAGTGFQNFRQFLYLHPLDAPPEVAQAALNEMLAQAEQKKQEQPPTRRWWEFWKQ